MSVFEMIAPKGMVRIMEVGPSSPRGNVIADYDSRKEAFRIADEYNEKRTDILDDSYHVFDDQGRNLRNSKHVRSPGLLGSKPSA